MEFSIRTLAPATAKTGCLILGVHEGSNGLTKAAQLADKASGGFIGKAIAQGDHSGRSGSTLLLRAVPGIAAQRVLLVGLGEKKGFNEAAYLGAVRAAAAATKDLGAADAVFALADLKPGKRALPWTARQAVLGFRDAYYAFDQLKTKKKTPPRALRSVTLAVIGAPATIQAQAAVKEAAATADGIDLARTLGNLPPNLCTPAYLADEARKIARQFKLGIEVLEQKDMEKLGMGALLAVSQGSRQPPKFVVLRYSGAAKSVKPVVLVGKGITFDTGGISLKDPRGEMDEMKYDMCVRRQRAGLHAGSHRLLGMRAPVNLVGHGRRLREHGPEPTPRKPGDIVTSRVRQDHRDPEYRRGRPVDSLRRAGPMPRASTNRRRWSISPRSPAPASSRSGTWRAACSPTTSASPTR